MENISTVSNKIKLDFKDSKYATGEEKVQLQKFGLKGSGNIFVNGKKMKDYFKRPVHRLLLQDLLKFQTSQPPLT